MENITLLQACERYGRKPPITQCELCGLMGRLLDDSSASAVWVSGTVSCEACRFWAAVCTRLPGVFQPRPACAQFTPRPDILILTVLPGDIREENSHDTKEHHADN